MGYICSSVGASFYPQGLTLASNCSQLPGAGRKKPLNIAEFLALLGVGEGLAPPESPRAIQGNQRAGQATALTAAQQDGAAKPPAAGTPLGQGRPGGENHPAIGPAAQGAWCGGRTRRHSKGNGPNTSLTQAQPRTTRGALRGERPKRFFPPFLIGEKWGISGASPPGALVFTRAMVEGPLSQKRRKRAVAGTACNSPQMSVITGTAWTQTAPRRCGQWPRRTCEPRTDT